MPNKNEIEQAASELFQSNFSESELIDFAFLMMNAGIVAHKDHGIETVARDTRLPGTPEPEEYEVPQEAGEVVDLGVLDRKGLGAPDMGGFNL